MASPTQSQTRPVHQQSWYGLIAYFLVYVDDLLLIGNDSKFLASFKSSLAIEFSLKDLGIELVPTEDNLFLTQHHYVCDLLHKANMHDAKQVLAPLSTMTNLASTGDASSCDHHAYHQLVSSMQYISLTHLNLAFSINKLS